jgi:predicted DNA-binding transcriptional regulator YafY
VPEYNELRTFNVDRILGLSVTEERFEPRELSVDAFEHSLGVHHGAPTRVALTFDPAISPYVRDRVWHSSQEIEEHADGGLTLTLTVSIDPALRSWILGFGHVAKVIAPPELAAEILAEIERMRGRYMGSIE